MKQLCTLVMAGLMAFVLSACGEDKPKEPEVKVEDATMQNQAPAADDAKSADATNKENEDKAVSAPATPEEEDKAVEANEEQE